MGLCKGPVIIGWECARHLRWACAYPRLLGVLCLSGKSCRMFGNVGRTSGGFVRETLGEKAWESTRKHQETLFFISFHYTIITKCI